VVSCAVFLEADGKAQTDHAVPELITYLGILPHQFPVPVLKRKVLMCRSFSYFLNDSSFIFHEMAFSRGGQVWIKCGRLRTNVKMEPGFIHNDGEVRIASEGLAPSL
jgi:hypothetical protein